MSRILITGVTGKSGMHFLDFLSKDTDYYACHQFTFIVHSEQKVSLLEPFPFPKTCVVGDLTDSTFLEKVFSSEQYDVLLHIAGTRLTPLLADIAVKHRIRHLILIHTTGIYSKYKRAAQVYVEIEMELRSLLANQNVTFTILRPTMIYGNLEDRNVAIFIKMVDKMRIFPVVSGARFELQPVHARDLGNAYYLVLKNQEAAENQEYNLSGGAPIQLIDMLKEKAGNLGVKNVFISVPYWLAYAGASMLFVVTFGKRDLREKVQRLVEPRTFSHEAAQRDFGYAPMTFEDGIKEEVAMYLQQKKA